MSSSVRQWILIWISACLCVAVPACGPEKSDRTVPGDLLIGAKIYEHPRPYEALFRECQEVGINALFVGEALAKMAGFRAEARAAGLPVFVIFPVFYDPEALKGNPDLFAITSEGTSARADWVEFVCPSRKEYRVSRAEALRNLISAYHPDGISLDFVRFFVYWEMVGPDREPDTLPQTCFCPVCLAAFEKQMNIHVPGELAGTAAKAQWILRTHLAEWAEWKCQVIAEVVESLAAEARKSDPQIMVNLHAVPWMRDDFGGAVRSVAGQDLSQLAPFLDFVSPMCYHHMVRQPPSWIHDVVVDVSARTGKPALPSIQISEAYIVDPLTPDEFRASLDKALEPPSKGVIFWSWETLSKSPAKKKIARSLIQRIMRRG